MNKPTLLVPIDFSSEAINALEYAVYMAKKLELPLLLMHAYFAPKSTIDIGTEIYYPEPFEEIQRKIMHRFRSLSKIIPALSDVEYKFELLYNEPEGAIVDCCSNNNVQLIIMGTRGVHGIDEYIAGSNTYKAIKGANIPVLMVPIEYKNHRIEKVVFASDYQKSDKEDVMLEFIKAIIEKFDAKLNILHIENDQEVGATYNELKNTKKFDEIFQHLHPVYHLLDKQDIEHGIENFASYHAIDLVIVIPKKHNFFENLIKSPVTKKLAFHSKIPILALK